MKKPATVAALERLGRVRLSPSFFMRDFLYSEIANLTGIPNVPDEPDLAIAARRRLCNALLEPLADRFGHIAIRSAYRAPAVNRYGNENNLSCARNESNYAGHIWDRRDAAGRMGATACIVVTAAIPYYERTGDWEALAWWVHDHLPYHAMEFYPRYAAFNLTWREAPERRIYSQTPPRRGWLTKPGMANHAGSHEREWRKLLEALS
jgi:hypothetical protein